MLPLLFVVGVVACGDDEPAAESGDRSTTTQATTSTSRPTTSTAASSTTVSGSPTADEEADDPTWDLNAGAWRGRNGTTVAVDCPPGGDAGVVWGTGTYTDDSSICTAAVHAGLISFDDGGRVVIEIRPGEESYESSSANGVTSSPYGAWDGSFVFVTD
jgi:hypothetical protein